MELTGLRVLVAGAGVSGRSAAAALVRGGARVVVTDADAARLEALHLPGVRLEPALEAPPDGTDLVVTSPGWRPEAPLLVAASRAGVEVIGEVELAWRIDQSAPQPAVWLAVTGTNGKTTTVGMLESILRAADLDAVAGGNVGRPVVDAVQAGHRVLAVELSSFQLHWSPSVRPHAGAVLNVAEDHLDWHGSMAAYAEAKARALTGGVAVANVDDPWAARLLSASPAPHKIGFTVGEPSGEQFGVRDGCLVAAQEQPLVDVAQIRPPGPTGVANALAAAALASAYGVAPEAVRNGLRAFQPGPHRGAVVGERGGVRYVDDSKATNPHAAGAALAGYQRVVWLAGGLLKGASVDDLVAANASRLAGVVLIGADRAEIAAALARHAPDVPVVQVASGDHGAMAEAVRAAAGLAEPGDVVLLAPAAASMDMFTDYAHRGDAFAAAVRELAADG
jgi:UDP-N-acetylmuramoylalanine--D-glutamate ligase